LPQKGKDKAHIQCNKEDLAGPGVANQRSAVFETFLDKLKGASFFLVQKIAEPHKYESNLKISDKEVGRKKR